MSLKEEERPLFIKKIPPPPPPAHGGAWKVAYADFVTAMMAFFLLLWLLNATTVDQKQGISNYFEPTGAIKGSSGSGGVFGGLSMTDPGVEKRPGETPEMTVGSSAQVDNDLDSRTRQVDEHDKVKSATPAEIEREQEELENAERTIKQAMVELPELSALKESLQVEVTDEGLLIQLVDQQGASLFTPGSSRLTPAAEKLLILVAKVAERLPNKIAISGHTDSTPLADEGGRTNWELSLERANAARRELVKNRVSGQRIESVIGRANREPLLEDDPNAPQNRRVSIVLLREKKDIPQDAVPPEPPRVF